MRTGNVKKMSFPPFLAERGLMQTASQVDEDTVVLGYTDGTLYSFAATTPTRKFIGHRDLEYLSNGSTSHSLEGQLFVSTARDGTANVWIDARDAPLATLVGHTGAVTSASVAGATNKIVTNGEDGTVRVWSLWPRVDESVNATENTKSCSITMDLPRGWRVVPGATGFSIYNDNNNKEKPENEAALNDLSKMNDAAYCISPHLKYLTLGTLRGFIEVWDIAKWKKVGGFDVSAMADRHSLVGIRLTLDERYFVALFDNTTMTIRWPVVETGKELILLAQAMVPKRLFPEPVPRDTILR